MGFFSRFPYTDFHRLNADWILDKIKEMLGIAQDAAETVESYDDRLIAVEAAAAGSVRYDAAQELTSQEQHRAQQNINVVDATVTSRIELSVSDLNARAVQVEQQSFTTTQQAQARDNIGAASAAGLTNLDETVWGLSTAVERCVRVDVPQTFTDEQKTRARDNIGAASQTDLNDDIDAVQELIDMNTSEIRKRVRFDLAQSLTQAEQAQARANIGAAAEGSAPAPAGAVLYDQQQSLTSAQKNVARNNIGAVSSNDPSMTGDLELSVPASATSAADDIRVEISSATNQSMVLLSGTQSGNVILSGLAAPVDGNDAVNKDYADSIRGPLLSSIAGSDVVLQPDAANAKQNTLYVCTAAELNSLEIVPVSAPAANREFTVRFTSGATPTELDTPLTILGLDDLVPEANTIYEINVLGNLAVWHSWEVPA